MLVLLITLKLSIYDLFKRNFYTDSSFNKFIDSNNEFGINQENELLFL